MQEISSKSNANIKYAYKILTSSKFRKKEHCFIIEGLRLCREAFNAGITIKTIFYTENCYDKNFNELKKIINNSHESYMISENIMKFISDTESPQGVTCICENIDKKNIVQNSLKNIILMENIQNPSNLGSIFRTCDALGVKTVAITSNSCDIYNPKVLRGSMGAFFRLNIILIEDILSFVKNLQGMGFKIYATVPSKNASIIGKMCFYKKSGIVLGNEGNGLTLDTINLCDEKITIPMNLNAESFNVSVAAGILIWEMTGRGDSINE